MGGYQSTEAAGVSSPGKLGAVFPSQHILLLSCDQEIFFIFNLSSSTPYSELWINKKEQMQMHNLQKPQTN